MYTIFKRRNWTPNQSYPHGFEPSGSEHKTTILQVDTIKEARDICTDHNADRPTYPNKGYFRFLTMEFTHE